MPATSEPGTNGSGGLIWYCATSLQQLGERDPRGVHVDNHALARTQHVRGLGLGEIDQLERAVGAGQVDDLDRFHAGHPTVQS